MSLKMSSTEAVAVRRRAGVRPRLAVDVRRWVLVRE
jgi:hypothetical protein